MDLTSLSQDQLEAMVRSLQEALELQQKEVACAVQEAGTMQQVMQALQVGAIPGCITPTFRWNLPGLGLMPNEGS